MNIGFTIPASLVEKMEETRPTFESRSHYASRLLSAALKKEDVE
jgi:hypothetical protein